MRYEYAPDINYQPVFTDVPTERFQTLQVELRLRKEVRCHYDLLGTRIYPRLRVLGSNASA